MQKTPALMKCSIQTVLSYVYAAAAKTDSTQRAQTIKMDRTIRKINSSLVSSYMCGFRWRRVFVKCPWTSPTYAVFRLLYLIMCCQKTHCTPTLTHLLGHENAKNIYTHTNSYTHKKTKVAAFNTWIVSYERRNIVGHTQGAHNNSIYLASYPQDYDLVKYVYKEKSIHL